MNIAWASTEIGNIISGNRQSTNLDFLLLTSLGKYKDGGGNEISCCNKLSKLAFLCWDAINKLVTILLHVCADAILVSFILMHIFNSKQIDIVFRDGNVYCPGSINVNIVNIASVLLESHLF